MQNDSLTAQTPHEPCFSASEVSQVAAKSITLAPHQMLHFDTCARCHRNLVEQRRDTCEVVYERFFPRLQPGASARDLRWSWMTGLWAATLLLPLLLPRMWVQQSAPAASGNFAVYATVKRDNKTLVAEEPLQSIGHLLPQDSLMLRIHPGVSEVRLSAFDHGAWKDVYEGTLTGDGRLPHPVILADSQATRLLVTACKHVNEPRTCVERVFEL